MLTSTRELQRSSFLVRMSVPCTEIVWVLKPRRRSESLKRQTYRFAGEIFVKTFPDLKEKQRVYRTQRGKKWEIEKSTFDERKALYRDPYKAQFQPSPIRHIRVVNGVPTNPLDTPVIQSA